MNSMFPMTDGLKRYHTHKKADTPHSITTGIQKNIAQMIEDLETVAKQL